MELTTLPKAIWDELQRAQNDRQHPWRTPVLASVDSDGLPRARTVVLRDVCSRSQTLQFFTDSRSPKVSQLKIAPKVQLVFWSPVLQWQLRVSADVQIATSGEDVETAWQQVKLGPARQDYLSPLSPGDELPKDARIKLGEEHHLAVLTASVNHIDWLSLHPDGHQRAEISARTTRWLTP